MCDKKSASLYDMVQDIQRVVTLLETAQERTPPDTETLGDRIMGGCAYCGEQFYEDEMHLGDDSDGGNSCFPCAIKERDILRKACEQMGRAETPGDDAVAVAERLDAVERRIGERAFSSTVTAVLNRIAATEHKLDAIEAKQEADAKTTLERFENTSEWLKAHGKQINKAKAKAESVGAALNVLVLAHEAQGQTVSRLSNRVQALETNHGKRLDTLDSRADHSREWHGAHGKRIEALEATQATDAKLMLHIVSDFADLRGSVDSLRRIVDEDHKWIEYMDAKAPGGKAGDTGDGPQECPKCGGKGQISVGHYDEHGEKVGSHVVSCPECGATCPRCNGTGRKLANTLTVACTGCHGTGRLKRKET